MGADTNLSGIWSRTLRSASSNNRFCRTAKGFNDFDPEVLGECLGEGINDDVFCSLGISLLEITVPIDGPLRAQGGDQALLGTQGALSRFSDDHHHF